MQTTTTVHVTSETRAYGEILTHSEGKRFMSLVIGEAPYGGTSVALLITDPAFLDKLANEAERLCREFVGDVPAFEPPSDDCPNCKADECECLGAVR